MAHNRQVPRRSGSTIGVASEVILRAIAWRHPQWHQVGSRGIILQPASSALRTRETTGVIVVLEGGDIPRVADLRGPLLLSSSTRLRRTIPGPPDQGRVERLHNRLCRWTRVSTLLRRWRRRRRCRQQQRRERCLLLHRERVHKVRGLLVARLILPPCRLSPLGRLRLRSLCGRGVKWGSRRLEMRMKCAWSSRTSMFRLSCAFLANARGEPLHFQPSWTRVLISRVCGCRS